MFVERRGSSSGRSDDHGAPVVEEVLVAARRGEQGSRLRRRTRWVLAPSLRATRSTGACSAAWDGIVALVTADGEFVIGRVTDWQPPQRFSLDFWLAVDPDHPTTLAFAPEGDRTRVTLTHGGWTAGNVGERAKFSDWPVLLDAFAEHVRRR